MFVVVSVFVPMRVRVRVHDRIHAHVCAYVCVDVHRFLLVSFDPWHVLCRVVEELRG